MITLWPLKTGMGGVACLLLKDSIVSSGKCRFAAFAPSVFIPFFCRLRNGRISNNLRNLFVFFNSAYWNCEAFRAFMFYVCFLFNETLMVVNGTTPAICLLVQYTRKSLYCSANAQTPHDTGFWDMTFLRRRIGCHRRNVTLLECQR